MKTNQVRTGIILSYGSTIVKTLATLVYIPVVLRLLGQSEYGLYQLVYTTVFYLSLLNFGLSSSYIRFYTREKKEHGQEGVARLNGLFMTVMLIIAAVAVTAGIVMMFNVEHIFSRSLNESELATAKKLMAIAVINTASQFPASVFSCFLASHERYAFQRGAVLISSLLEPLISIPILMLGFGSVGMMCTVAFLGIAQLVAYMTYCLKVLKMRFTFKNPQFGLLKEIYIFSFFVFLNDINSQFNWSADKFLLGIFKGTDEVAVYALSSQVNTMFCTFGKAVATMFVPRINRIVADGCDKSQLNTLFARVGRVQTEILMLIILGFTFAGKGFIALWGGEGYEHSYYTALLLIYSALPEQLQSLGVEIQMAMNKHKFRSVCYFFIGLANVAISIPLCRAFGAVGSATGTAISLFIGTVVVMNVYYVKAIGLDAAAFWKEILRTVPGLAVSAAAGFALTRIIHISSILSLAAFAVIFTLIYCGAMWLLSLNDYEKGIVKGAMAKLKK